MMISKAAITSFSLRRPHSILTANLIIVVTIQRSSFILLLKPKNNLKGRSLIISYLIDLSDLVPYFLVLMFL